MPETNITLKVNSSELDAKLSKSMKELKVGYDEYGRLVNAQGKFVGGLSQASIRVGNYIDELGRLRNANGQLMEGMTKTQQALRMYRDEFGLLRDAAGNTVGEIDSLGQLISQLADSSTKATISFKMFSEIGGPLGEVAKAFGDIQAKTNLFITSINEIQRAGKVFNAIKAQIDAVGKKQALVNLLTTNYIALSAGIASVIVVAMEAFGDRIADNIVSLEGVVDALDKTTMAYESVKNRSDAFQKSFASAGAQLKISMKDQANQLIDNIDLLDAASKKGSIAQKILTGGAIALTAVGVGVTAALGWTGVGAVAGAGIAGVGLGLETVSNHIGGNRKEAAQKLEEAQKQLADQLYSIIEQDLPKKESVALQERLDAYEAYKKVILERCDVDDENIARVLDKLDEAMASMTERIKEAKINELDKDIAKYFEEAKNHALTYEETVEKITEAAKKNELSHEEMTKAIDRAKEAFNQKDRQDLGVDSMLESIKTPTERYNEALEKVATALEKGYITLEQSEKIKEKLKESTGLTKDEPEQDRKQDLGVDSMLKSIITPMEQYRESLKKADQALQEGFITEEQCTKLKKKYAEETFSDVLGKLEETKSAQEKYNEEIQRANDALREGVITANQCSELQKQYAKELYSQVFSVLEGTKTAQEKYNEVIREATEAHKAGVITDREYAAIKKKTAQDMYSDVVSSLASMKTSQQKYEEATKRAEEARRAGVISEKEETALKKKYADDLRQQKMQSLGLNSLLDEIKTPMEKYKEQIQKVDEGLKDKLITKDEAQKMKDLLYKKFFPEDFESDKSPDLKRVEDRAKEAPMAKSVTAGSQEMYSIIAGQNKDRVDKIENNLASFVDLFRDYSNKFDEFARDQGEVQFAMLS
ncbi:MAG: hypothetical protein IJH68_00605 [Thermoguttaceae bacterium]|nr:hypothetical protein [Thermoguttaceae bacterium]